MRSFSVSWRNGRRTNSGVLVCLDDGIAALVRTDHAMYVEHVDRASKATARAKQIVSAPASNATPSTVGDLLTWADRFEAKDVAELAGLIFHPSLIRRGFKELRSAPETSVIVSVRHLGRDGVFAERCLAIAASSFVLFIAPVLDERAAGAEIRRAG